MNLSRPRRWTLRTKLVASVLALFFLVTVAVGALTVWRLNSTLMSQVDRQLITAANNLAGDRPGNRGGPGSVSGGSSLQLDLVAGTDSVKLEYNGMANKLVPSAWINTPGGHTALNEEQIAQLSEAGIGERPMTLMVKGAGEYRLIAVQHPEDVVSTTTGQPGRATIVSIVGLPVKPVRDNVEDIALSVAFLSGAGILLVGLACTAIIQRNLEPLRRVAGTATKVSQLQLSRGEVDIAERVADRDTDPGTEVGQVGYALNNLLDHMGTALSARQASETRVRQFVADASHELRTPLASIRGYAELSRRETDPVPPGVTHALSRIESESDRMTALVEDLLLLARLDSGRRLDREPVDVSMLVIETISDAHAAGREHEWKLDLPDEAVEILGDQARLRQVIINLLANARRHTPAGTTVTTGVRDFGDHIEIQVRDDGPGIDPQLVPHIFERFIRGDSARTRTEGSTGLGLSIVRAVVASHGGHVGVASEPGNTVFTISLPKQALPRTPDDQGA